MKLTENIFGKNLEEITEKDFKDYFLEEREETSNIEYKSGEVEINDLFKEICAFLNTDGGLIFIGTPREKKITISKKSTKRICQGEPVPSNFSSKSWLMQKIASNISPLPANIKIQEILTENGNYFIVEVPQSQTPPHQCIDDGRYYIRLDESARPAPHGIVQELFFKRQKPQIKTKTNLTKYKDYPDNVIELEIFITNESDYPTENISFLIRIFNIEEIDTESKHENSGNFRKKSDNSFVLQDTFNNVLIERIGIPISFNVIHFFTPFLVSIIVWGKDFGIYEDSYIWEPIDNKLIKGFKTGDDSNLTLQDLIDILETIK